MKLACWLSISRASTQNVPVPLKLTSRIAGLSPGTRSAWTPGPLPEIENGVKSQGGQSDGGGGEPQLVAVHVSGPQGHLGSIGSSPETVPDALVGLSKLPDIEKVLLV
jgi:hypothetical protein